MVVVGGGGGGWWVVVGGGGGGGGWWCFVAVGPCRPREATEASSRAQILARCGESCPPTPPGPLKLRLFGWPSKTN